MSTDAAKLRLKFNASGQIESIDDLSLTSKEEAELADLIGPGEVDVQAVLASHHIDRTAILSRREWVAREALERAAEYRRQMVEAAGKIDIRLGTEADAKFICDQAGKVLHDATVRYATVVRQCTQFGLACPPPVRVLAAGRLLRGSEPAVLEDVAAGRAHRKARAAQQAAELHDQMEAALEPYKEKIKELFEDHAYDSNVENLAHLLSSLESVRRLRQQPDRAVRTALDPSETEEDRVALADRRHEEERGEHAHLGAPELAALDCWLQRSVDHILQLQLDSDGEDAAEETKAAGSEPGDQH